MFILGNDIVGPNMRFYNVSLTHVFCLKPPLSWPQVLLVSAQEALLSRLVLRRQPAPAPDVVRRFKERAFGSSRVVQRRTYSQAELDTAAQDMCEDSGESL